MLLVHGESGVGKSALVRHFIERLERASGVVLAGRCYERESVPYKAVDDVVDELSWYLKRLPPARRRRAAAADTAPRSRSCSRCCGGCRSSPGDAARSEPAPEPRELRARAFAALRELFARSRGGTRWCW